MFETTETNALVDIQRALHDDLPPPCAPLRLTLIRSVDGYFKVAPPLFPRLRPCSSPTEGVFTFHTHDATSVLRAWERVLDFLHYGHGFWRLSVCNPPSRIHGPWDGLPVIGASR